MAPKHTAEQRILRFLETNREGNLRVIVAYASIGGLAWLHKRTKERRVELLIGNIWEKRFEKGNNKDRQNAIEFLRRDDVIVKNWYFRNDHFKAEAHMKAWLVKNGSTYKLLTGSANLSRAGLMHNYELMVEPTDNDANISISQISEVWQKAWDCKGKLLESIESSKPALPRKSLSGRPSPGSWSARYGRQGSRYKSRL